MKKYKSELTRMVDRGLFISGRTRKDVAEQAGVTYQWLNNVLTSKSFPSVEVCDILANAIGEKPEKLRRVILKCYERRQAERNIPDREVV